MSRAEVWLIGALCLGGCGTPNLVATAGPADSSIYVDGRLAGAYGYADLPLGYYGDVALSARVNPRAQRETDYEEEYRLLAVPPPFSRWLFPLDFFLETVTYPFRDPYDREVNMPLQPRTLLQPGVADKDAEVIRARAEKARLER